jgi:uncharacterized protein (DUF849 family)
MIGAAERVAHIARMPAGDLHARLRHDEFAEADYVMTNTPGMLRAMGRDDDRHGRQARDRGLRHRPSVVRQGAGEGGRARAPALVQLCMGVPWGAPNDLNTFMAMVNNVPPTGPGRPFRWAATRWPMSPPRCWRAAMCGSGWRTICGSTRACWRPTRSSSSARADIVENMGARVIGPDAVRARLGLTKRPPLG